MAATNRILWNQRDRDIAAAVGSGSMNDGEDTPQPDDLGYDAWCVIANVGHNRGGWDAQDPEWVAAAVRWRDRWHATLPSATSNV